MTRDLDESRKKQSPPLFVQYAEDVAHRINSPCTVCLLEPIDTDSIERLLQSNQIVSIILPAEDSLVAARYPDQIGWFVGDNVAWKLPTRIGSELIFVGNLSGLRLVVAIQAFRTGIKAFYCLTPRVPLRRIPIARILASKTFDAVMYRTAYPVFRLVLRVVPIRILEWWYEAKLAWVASKITRQMACRVETPAPEECSVISKILLLSASLGPGGSERQVCSTLLGMKSRGFKNLTLLHENPMTPPNNFYLQSLLDAGIDCKWVKPIPPQYIDDCLTKANQDSMIEILMPLGWLADAILAYTLEFFERKPQIVHTWLDHMNVIAGYAALISGVPRIVLSCRSLSPRHFSFYQPYMGPIYRLLARSPNVVFLNNSEAGARDYAAWLGIAPERIQVIRNGFDFDAFPDASSREPLAQAYRQRHQVKTGDLVVGTVIRLSEEKRPVLWLDIAARVARELPNVTFLVVGDGPMREHLTAMAFQKGIGEKVRFTGYERDIPSALAAFDVFLLTSRVEGLPNVLVEAQAMGVPVVTINAGGAGETLCHGKTGWLVDSDDPTIIADKIVSILKDTGWRAEAALAARDHALTRFGRDRMVEETLRVYGGN